jgi:2-keto-4-pentenoate hydratase
VAAAARRLGGLPAGALLVAAGLTPPLAPQPGLALRAGFGALGRVQVRFEAG